MLFFFISQSFALLMVKKCASTLIRASFSTRPNLLMLAVILHFLDTLPPPSLMITRMQRNLAIQFFIILKLLVVKGYCLS